MHTPVLSFLAVYTFKTNLNLGIFTAIFSLVAILLILFIKRFTKIGNRKIFMIVLATLSVVASVLVVCDIAKWSYIVFNLILTPSIAAFATILEYHRSVLLKKTGHYSDIAEHQVVVEFCFGISRVLMGVLMLLLGFFLEIIGFKI